MLSIQIVLDYSLLVIDEFAIHTLCTKFVCLCTWLSSVNMCSDTFPPKVLTVPN